MSQDEIPVEYLPSLNTEADDYTDIGAIFHDDDDDHDSKVTLQNVVVNGNLAFTLKLPPDIGTLFAHRVWSGSIYLSEFLSKNASTYIKNKSTIEFGAGTALPSLVALALGSSVSIITDYPDKEVIQTIKETVGRNWERCGYPSGRVGVVGHEWGRGVEEVHNKLLCLCSTTKNAKFDVAFLSECLWMHRSHEALVQSVDRLLHATTGKAIFTYAHHVPGYESADDAFFDLCERRGFATIHTESRAMSYMWDNEKTIEIYLRVISRQKSE